MDLGQIHLGGFAGTQCVAAAAAQASLLPPLSRSVSVTGRFVRTSPIGFSDLNRQGDLRVSPGTSIPLLSL